MQLQWDSSYPLSYCGLRKWLYLRVVYLFWKEGEGGREAKRTLSSLIAHFFYEGFLGAIKTNRPCAKKACCSWRRRSFVIIFYRGLIAHSRLSLTIKKPFVTFDIKPYQLKVVYRGAEQDDLETVLFQYRLKIRNLVWVWLCVGKTHLVK